MERKTLEEQAKIISARFGNSGGLGFYCFAVKKLHFERCYQLASLALQESREGKVRTSAARYFNGCVMREIKNLRL